MPKLSIKSLLSLCLIIFLSLAGLAQEQNGGSRSIKKISILYTNDLHSHFEPLSVAWISETRKVGGFANIASIVKREKKTNPYTFYFDAGDFFTGPSFCSLTDGEAVIDVMNHLSLDAVCIGNHEFDYGSQNMLSQFEEAKFPILNGNIFYENSENLIWNNPYIILKKRGIKIAVIGLHGKFAFYDTVADTMRYGIQAKDEALYLQEYVDYLKGKVDLIVLLVHQGIPGRQSSKGEADISRNLQKDIDLAHKVDGVDLMITGHAHQGTPQALMSNGTIIVSTDALGNEVGKLELEYDKKLHKIINYSNSLAYLFDDEIEDDIATEQAIEKWKSKLAEITEERICSISQPLTRSYGEESLLGNMVADAMLFAYPAYDIAFVNSGGLREDIAGPDVTAGNLISAFPFPNTVVQQHIKGDVLKELFEHSAGQTNGVLQVSEGTIIHYNDSLPPGSRVVYCMINGEAIDESRSYKILTNNFLAAGGDGFLGFQRPEWERDTHIEVLQTMISYMRSFDVYHPELSGRVVRLNQ